MGSPIKALGLVAFASVALAAALPEHASAQTVETGFRGLVRIRMVSDYPFENPFGGGFGKVLLYDFLPGESQSFLVTAGHSGNLCQTGASGPLPIATPELQTRLAQQEASAQYVWHIDVHMIEVGASSITFDLSWQRTSRAPDERLQYSHRVTLRQDESRAVDLLHGAPGGSCLGVTLLVEGGLTDDPSLQGKIVEWDVWGGVGSTTSRQKLRSVQGEAGEFRFDPIAVPGQANGREVFLSGTVTGRVRLDGNIDVAIFVRRMTMQKISQAELIALLRKQRERGTDGGGFRKNFTAKPGETVKIVLPRNAVSQVTATGPVTGRPIVNSVPEAFETSITVQARVR
jgi:hypothetical protein